MMVKPWVHKVDDASQLLSEALASMSKEELEEYGWNLINPAYESLMDVMLKLELNKKAP